jgi:hypothetical protein
MIGPSCPVSVSYEGYVCLSVPSPCARRYRLRVLWTDPTPCHPRLSYLVFRFGLPERIQEWSGPPKSRMLLSTHTALFVDPGRPSGILPVARIPLYRLPVR